MRATVLHAPGDVRFEDGTGGCRAIDERRP